MTFHPNRREFVKTLLAGAAGLNLAPALTRAAAGPERFSFLLLGDLHFDRPEHHDMEWLARDKPDDVRQVREYTRQTREIVPRLFGTLKEAASAAPADAPGRVAFALQVGDVVEGLCGSGELALKQNRDAIDFVRGAKLGVPFLFTKGNHDVTGPGAAEAFAEAFIPFLQEQARAVSASAAFGGACYAVERGDALFCFYDAYDRKSLEWLEAALARRTARHCFVVVHPPVVPYGARATWHLFSAEADKARRERLLDLLGKQNAFVLGGHIHKYNLMVRTTPRGGRFLQFALSSVISELEVTPKHVLNGVGRYNADQVEVEPDFSPATREQRRAVYAVEAPFVKQFEYADLPGYAVLSVNGPQVTANMYSGVSRRLWQSLDLTKELQA